MRREANTKLLSLTLCGLDIAVPIGIPIKDGVENNNTISTPPTNQSSLSAMGGVEGLSKKD